MTGSDRPAAEDAGNGEGPVIHDRRRIDPLTGQVRHGKHAASRPAGTPPGAGRPASEPPASEPKGAPVSGLRSDEGATKEDAGSQRPEASEPAGRASEPEKEASEPGNTASELEDMRAQLDERTGDLQRLQAEYVNYRKRVDRDRVLVKEQAVAATLTGLLPVLDAIDQAREHGELSGGFKSVADSLQAALGRLGLITYGEKGDAFDPKIHEALTYSYSPDVTEDSCVEILQPGYKVGEKILRPARVAVAAPATGPDGASVISDDSTETGDPDEEGN
ncbi:MAG TPA: nucleotide exchange factor GrpE [Streptosporangiaceae bacterium]|nr:nucleotide exchange factor GrpE [Streptosporangiaceae bacterium]